MAARIQTESECCVYSIPSNKKSVEKKQQQQQQTVTGITNTFTYIGANNNVTIRRNSKFLSFTSSIYSVCSHRMQLILIWLIPMYVKWSFSLSLPAIRLSSLFLCRSLHSRRTCGSFSCFMLQVNAKWIPVFQSVFLRCSFHCLMFVVLLLFPSPSIAYVRQLNWAVL